MIKLNCGVSRKVGEPNYGSRGASMNLELELESSAAQDTKLLHEKIRRLFALARSSVDEELGLVQTPSTGASQPAQSDGGAPQAAPGPAANGNGSRPVTEGQLRAIRAICSRLGLDQDAEAARRFQRPTAELSLSEASKFIDDLKQLQNGSPSS